MPGEVLIVAEYLEGRVAPSTLELIAAGRTLAEAAGGRAQVLVLGHPVDVLARTLATYGAKVLSADHPALAEYSGDAYVQAVRGVVESTRPRFVLVAHTAQGYDLAPTLAGSLDLPLVTNCLSLSLQGDRLRAVRRILNEKVQVEVEIGSEKSTVVTMRPGSVPPAEGHPGAGDVTAVPVSIDSAKLRDAFVRLERPEDKAGRAEREDRAAEAVRRLRDQRRDAARRGDEGREPDRRDQHGPDRADLRGRPYRIRRGRPQASPGHAQGTEVVREVPGAFI